MCDPTTILIGSTAMQAVGQIQQGNAANSQAQYEAGQLAMSAGQEMDAAKQKAKIIRRQTEAQRSAAVAAQAASGVKIGEGSALEAERAIVTAGEEDAFMTLLTGQRRYDQLAQQAAMTRRAGVNAQYGGYMNAAGTVLNAYGEYTRWGAKREQIAQSGPPQGGTRRGL
jgi:hypothetical protein